VVSVPEIQLLWLAALSGFCRALRAIYTVIQHWQQRANQKRPVAAASSAASEAPVTAEPPAASETSAAAAEPSAEDAEVAAAVADTADQDDAAPDESDDDSGQKNRDRVRNLFAKEHRDFNPASFEFSWDNKKKILTPDWQKVTCFVNSPIHPSCLILLSFALCSRQKSSRP
jgi:hypothetical protein